MLIFIDTSDERIYKLALETALDCGTPLNETLPSSLETQPLQIALHRTATKIKIGHHTFFWYQLYAYILAANNHRLELFDNPGLQ